MSEQCRYSLVNDEREGHLGRGTFGEVKKVARNSDGKVSSLLPGASSRSSHRVQQIFACKIIHFDNSQNHRGQAESECLILSRLDHPNIVKYLEIIWSSTTAKIYMNYCAGGSLADFINHRRYKQFLPQER